MCQSRYCFEPDHSPDREAVVEAWREAGGSRPPESVDRLVKVRSRQVYQRAGARIFRLSGVGPRGRSVVAKRGPSARLAVEALVYREVLPSLSLTAPAYHGYIERGTLSWLFMEEVIGVPFQHTSSVHRELAVRWLAKLHLGTSQLDLKDKLPAEGPSEYANCLMSARESMVSSLDALGSDAQRKVNMLLETLESIEGVWGEACQRCAEMPHCLVHADFANKNVMIVARGDRHDLIALDWGIAGYGVPAPDLEHLYASDYLALVKPVWTNLRLADVAYLKAVGVVMRHLGIVEAWARCLRRETDWSIEKLSESVEPLTGGVNDLVRG